MKCAMLALSVFAYLAQAQEAETVVHQVSYGGQSPVLGNVTNTNVTITYNNWGCPSSAFRSEMVASSTFSSLTPVPSYSFGPEGASISSSPLLFPTLSAVGISHGSDSSVAGIETINSHSGFSIDPSAGQNGLITLPDHTSALKIADYYVPSTSGPLGDAVNTTDFNLSLKIGGSDAGNGADTRVLFSSASTFEATPPLHQTLVVGIDVASAFYAPSKPSDLSVSQIKIEGLQPMPMSLIGTVTQTGLEWPLKAGVSDVGNLSAQ